MRDPEPNYFYVNRSLLNSDRWLGEKFTRGQAWVDLFGLARHKDGYVRIRGIKIEVKRGQLAYSQLSLAERWGWSRGKVRRYLEELENDGNIVQQTEHQGTNVTTVITIVNYDRWQGGSTPNSTPNGHQTVHQTDTKQYTYNKDNKDNKEKKREKKTSSSKIKNQTKEIIDYWNKTKKGQLKSINPYKKNLEYWLDGGYTLDDVKEAIDKIEVGLDWANEPDLELLLRQRDKSQQPVDRIGKCLSAEKKDGDSKVLT